MQNVQYLEVDTAQDEQALEPLMLGDADLELVGGGTLVNSY